jgi:hypothetical protein
MSKLIKIYGIFCVSKSIHFSFCNVMDWSWNISIFSWNSAALFDAWVRVLSDVRISIIPTTTNVCFFIGSLHLGNFIPAFCCVYNEPNLISIFFIPEPCQTGIKWKLLTILGVLNFVNTLNILTIALVSQRNEGQGYAPISSFSRVLIVRRFLRKNSLCRCKNNPRSNSHFLKY